MKFPRQKRSRAAKPIGRTAREALFGQSWFDEFRNASLHGGDARKFLDDDQKSWSQVSRHDDLCGAVKNSRTFFLVDQVMHS